MNKPQTTLTAGQRALLQVDLERRRDELSQQLEAHLRGRTRAERAHDMRSQDGDDAPQRAPEIAMAAALTERERGELEVVTGALKRLAAGSYGDCLDCGNGIPFDRLRVEPWALRCVDCEARHETRRR